MNSQHFQQQAFHPFGERLANLENRTLNFRAQVDIIALYCEDLPESQLDDQRKQYLQLQFPPSEGLELKQISKTASLLLNPSRAQLSAALVGLREAEKGITHCLNRCRELVRQGDLVSAVRELIDLESERLHPAEKIVDIIRRVAEQRLKGSNAIRNAASDLMAGEVYESIQKKVGEDLGRSEEVLGLPALLLESGSFYNLQEWEAASQAFTKTGLSIPVNIQGCEESDLPQVWNLIRFCFPICRQLSHELGLLSEVNFGRAAFGIAARQPQVAELSKTWSEEILAEVLATLIGGPAYVGANIETMAYSTERVLYASEKPTGLPSYLRWELQFLALQELGYRSEAESYRSIVHGIYGPPAFACSVYGPKPVLAEFIALAPTIAQNIFRWNFRCLNGATVRHYLPEFDMEQQEAAKQIAEAVSASPNLTSPSSFWSLSEVSLASGSKADSNGAEKSSDKKRGAVKDGPSILSVAAGCRFAFEKLSTQAEVPGGFAGSCYHMLISALKASAQEEGITSSRKLTVDDVKRLSRKMRNRSFATVQASSAMM